jgi:hypothetical protein
MKQLLLSIVFLITLSPCFSQKTCEQREKKLLEGFGSFSAGFLYNTYGLIGSITDGYIHKAYSKDDAYDLLEAQKKLADNMTKMLNGLKTDSTFQDQKNINYVTDAAKIIEGLKKQASLIQEYTRSRKQKELDAYEEQRKKNWKDVSTLMGIEE